MMKSQFLLNPEITFLNHGSFGACPKPIFEDYQKWQLELEREPIQFITKTGLKYLNDSKQALASYINCDADDFVYVPNPTTAMNTVIKSLKLKAGDEILSTNQEYGAIKKTWNYYCQKANAEFVEAPISLPLVSKEKFLEEFWSALTPKTTIVFLSHITSETALIFPIKEIIEKAKILGLMTIIDGAHAPGHIDLDLKMLDPDVYTGACHKWMLTPKGNSFLYVKKHLQNQIEPLIVSWGYESAFPSHSKFLDWHQYNGTRDFSAYLTTPKAINWLKENDWKTKTDVCKKQLLEYYPIVAKELDADVICPLTNDFLGQICSIPIQTKEPFLLKELLYNKYKIEIPVVVTPKQNYLRISFQAYNGLKEIETLIDAIRDIKRSGNLL